MNSRAELISLSCRRYDNTMPGYSAFFRHRPLAGNTAPSAVTEPACWDAFPRPQGYALPAN